MGAVGMNVNILPVFAKNIAAPVAALVQNQTGFSMLHRLTGEYRAKQTAAYN